MTVPGLKRYRYWSLLLFFLLYSFSTYAQLKTETGVASYYGKRFHGRQTASGEVFDKGKMTAAHRTLPFGTIVKVTREDNGNFIYVRINDRGPFIRNRVIDLSRKAAEKLGIVRRGHQKVVVEVLQRSILPEDLLSRQPFRKVHSRLASVTVRGLNPPGAAAAILPVLKKKAASSSPIQRLPETFLKRLVREVFPEG